MAQGCHRAAHLVLRDSAELVAQNKVVWLSDFLANHNQLGDIWREYERTMKAQCYLIDAGGPRIPWKFLLCGTFGCKEITLPHNDIKTFKKSFGNKIHNCITVNAARSVAQDTGESIGTRQVAAALQGVNEQVQDNTQSIGRLQEQLAAVERRQVESSSVTASTLQQHREAIDANREAIDANRVAIQRCEEDVRTTREYVLQQLESSTINHNHIAVQRIADVVTDRATTLSPEPDDKCVVCLEVLEHPPFGFLCDDESHKLHALCAQGILRFHRTDSGDGFHVLNASCPLCRELSQNPYYIDAQGNRTYAHTPLPPIENPPDSPRYSPLPSNIDSTELEGAELEGAEHEGAEHEGAELEGVQLNSFVGKAKLLQDLLARVDVHIDEWYARVLLMGAKDQNVYAAADSHFSVHKEAIPSLESIQLLADDFGNPYDNPDYVAPPSSSTDRVFRPRQGRSRSTAAPYP